MFEPAEPLARVLESRRRWDPLFAPPYMFWVHPSWTGLAWSGQSTFVARPEAVLCW